MRPLLLTALLLTPLLSLPRAAAADLTCGGGRVGPHGAW
jgi:hypothetical protein